MDRDPERNERPEEGRRNRPSDVARAMLAVLFVAALGAALAIPLIRGEDSRSTASSPSRAHTSRPPRQPTKTIVHRSPTPSASASPSLPSGILEVSGKYPKSCLRAAAARVGAGQIASFSRGTVTITDIGGSVVARFESDTPVRWSPSGEWLLGTDGHLWSNVGEDRGMLFPTGSGAAIWSPSADCAFAFSADEDELLVGRPGRDPVAIVDGDLQAFEVSPDGRHVGAATYAGSEAPQVVVASIDLKNHSASAASFDTGVCCVVFGGWWGNDTPLLWAGAGVSVMADGTKLQALEPKHGAATLHTLARSVVPDPTYVVRCGDLVVGVVGGGRPYPTVSDKRLAILAPDRAPDYLTGKDEAYISPSCSTDGSYVAAVGMPDGGSDADGHVSIVSSSGGVLQALTSGSDLGDYKPDWGPQGTGVLFGRKPADAKQWTLWYAPEGSSPHSLTIKSESWDWSATPPTGEPGG